MFPDEAPESHSVSDTSLPVSLPAPQVCFGGHFAPQRVPARSLKKLLAPVHSPPDPHPELKGTGSPYSTEHAAQEREIQEE